MAEKKPLQTALSKPYILKKYGDIGSFIDHHLSLKLSNVGAGEKIYFKAGSYLSDDKRHLDWKALDRAARLIATASVAPVRRRKSQAAARAREMFGNYGNVSDVGTVSSTRSRDSLPDVAAASVPDMMAFASGHGVISPAKHEEGFDSGGGSHRVAAEQVSSVIAQSGATKDRSQVRAGAPDPHAPASIKTVLAQVRGTDQSGATLDLAKFAEPGGVSYAGMISATHINKTTTLTHAVALSSPSWKGNLRGGLFTSMVSGTGEDHKPGGPESYSDTGRAVDVGSMAIYAAPKWIQAGSRLVEAPNVEQAGDRMGWFKSTQAQPAAPHNINAGVEPVWGKMLSAQRGRRMSSPSSPETHAADLHVGTAQDTGQILPSDDAVSTGLDTVGDTRQQVLDEMTRLASRPSAGVTGFNAGQMPAWLGGWTGSV